MTPKVLGTRFAAPQRSSRRVGARPTCQRRRDGRHLSLTRLSLGKFDRSSTCPLSPPVTQQALALVYHFEPGRHDDGVTLEVPWEMLARLNAEHFEWLVHGLLAEKVLASI